MKLPRGRLIRRRVVDDLARPLESVLETELTGYVKLESQEALLLDGDGVGVITFETGIPVVAYHTGTDNGGADALADIAVAGPYRLELFELEGEELATVHETESLQVPPGLPAQQLTGDPELYERTREKAPTDRVDEAKSTDQAVDAIDSFLADQESIEKIRQQARKEAESRAKEWGFDVPTP